MSLHPPLRILMAVPKYPFPVLGGLERQAHELARALAQRGNSIHVLSSLFDPGQQTIAIIDGVRVRRLPWVENKVVRFLLSPMGVANILIGLRGQVDLVHVHNISWFGAFVTLIAKSMGLPVITKLPGNGEFGIPGMRRKPFGRIRLACMKRSDVIVAMAQQSIDELQEIGYPRERVLKVPNGIQVLDAAPAPPRPRYVIDVVFVGRLSSEKGLFDLIHAWRIVKARSTRPLRLRLIGDGPQGQALKALTSTLDLEDSIVFSGFCENVPLELAQADIFVSASYSEGNSNSVLEAMRAALPVVATAVGGTALQVGPEGNRFLATPGDRAMMAERLLELIEDESLRVRTGGAMRARIENVFEIGRVAASYEEAYRLMLRSDYAGICEINQSLFQQGEQVND